MLKYMRKEPRLLEDVWKAVLNHSIEARDFTEDVYRLDLRGAFAKKGRSGFYALGGLRGGARSGPSGIRTAGAAIRPSASGRESESKLP